MQIQQQHAHDYQAIRDAVTRAEDAGVDAIFNWDHFHPLYSVSPQGRPQYGDTSGAHFGDGWTLLAAWAEQTSRAQLGVLVTCLGYRNPDLLAYMARTVDHISGGRLILGVGAGWLQKDYVEHGYEFGTAGSRLDLFAQYLERIETRLGKLNPPPPARQGQARPEKPMPVLIGGSGERKTLPAVAEHADIWHSFLPVPEFIRKSAVLAEHCAAIGRDDHRIERSVGWPGSGSSIMPAVEAKKAPSVADDYREAGAALFTVGVSGPDYDFTTLEAALRWRDANS